MKRIVTIGICGLGLLSLASCNNDEFLDVTDTDFIPLSAFYENDDQAKLGMNGVYDMMFPSSQDGDWGFKPNLFSGTHPTMDTQCTGWDVKFLDQSWDATTTELGSGWAHAYHAIARANIFLEGLEKATTVSDEVKNKLIGEARAVRGFFYHYLATTWGRVPMLGTGEDYNNTPIKAKADSYEEMWDFIIDDFKGAAELLDWTPMDNQYGRATKGMALSYLGDAYMWKAYRCPDQAADCYAKAKAALKDVLDNGPYKLQPSFSTLWDPEGAWSKECIWAQVIDEGEGWTGWSNLSTNFNLKWYVACPENGGWGSLVLSWEWYACYEQGDERRDASCCTGAVPVGADSYKENGKDIVDVTSPSYGKHPFLNIEVGNGTAGTNTKQYHFFHGEYAPAIWTTKLWRNGHAGDLNDVGSWGWGMWAPVSIYYKRLPNVMLDYAECCFRTGEEEKGWAEIDKLRRRAFGLDEVGVDLTPYLKHHNFVCEHMKLPTLSAYPIQNTDASKTFKPAKELYTADYTSPRGKKFSSEPWKVAVNEERRKEFNTEWCLRPDMQKSGFMADHIETNYPTDATKGDASKNYPWSHREFTYDDKRMDMPFPQDELSKNTALIQNDAYLGNNSKGE